MTLGFIGAGTMTSAIVAGLQASGRAPERILLSPRNAKTATDLAARYSGVAVAGSNQEVLDQSDTVILAIRPQGAESVLRQLRFKPTHQVISIIAALGVDRLHSLVAPAASVVRAVPLPNAARRQSPTALYPARQDALELMNLVGFAFAVATEEQFNALCTATAAVASYFAFAHTVASWLAGRGIPPAQARDYVARILPPLQEEAVHTPDLDFRSMARLHATAGGLNEQILNRLDEHGAFGALSDALDQVMQRIAMASSAKGTQ